MIDSEASNGKTILVIVDACMDYHHRIAERLAARAREHGLSILVIAGGGLEDATTASTDCTANAIYDLAERFDAFGTIVLAGSLGHQVPVDVVEGFLTRFAHRPLVSLDLPARDIPSVCTDDETTMRALMELMTSDPSRRRFAFVQGHPGSHGSLVRERVFRTVLRERGIGTDEGLILRGNYRAQDTFRAVDDLLRDGKRFDALVAANDVMAASALRALLRHGVSIPDDVLVSGFGDAPAAWLSSPPLTTVHADLEAQTDAALALLLERHDNCDAPVRHVEIAGRVIVRPSSDPRASSVATEPRLPRDNRAAISLMETMSDAAARMPGIDPGLSIALAERLTAALDGDTAGLMETLRLALRPAPDRPVDVRWWRHVQYEVDAFVRGAHGDSLGHRAPAILSMLHGAINDAIWSEMQNSTTGERATNEVVEQLHLTLGRTRTRPALDEALVSALTWFGAKTFVIIGYDCAPCSVPGARASILFDNNTIGQPDAPTESFDSDQLVPRSLDATLRENSLILQPLQTAGVHLGYLLHDLAMHGAVSMEPIAQSIANALQRCWQLDALELRARKMHEENADLARQAGRDSLTGLPNRAGFLEALELGLRDAQDRDREAALLYFDLDGFKAINDTHGHATGDRLLRTVATRVRAALRTRDVVARLGGDEFTVILQDVSDRAAATEVAEVLLAELSRPITIDGERIRVSASIGIARYPVDGEDSDALIRHADAAMYRAKAEGRNRYAWFCRSIETRELERLELDRALREALGAGELTLAWQPRIEIASGRPVAFEALLRWNAADSVGREVGPAEFIPVAERSGFVCELDSFAFDQTCRQLAAWQAVGCDVSVSVNLSAASLRADDTTARIAASLKRHAVEPSRIELELTESVAMSDVERNVERLDTLRALGLRLAIDDFGTAYSSLNYLKRLPVDCLKIDRSFLVDIDDPTGGEGADAAIVRAIVALGHELGFRIVAEGIESDEQHCFLQSIGCDEAQGYLFGRPMPADDVARWLDDCDREFDAAA